MVLHRRLGGLAGAPPGSRPVLRRRGAAGGRPRPRQGRRRPPGPAAPPAASAPAAPGRPRRAAARLPAGLAGADWNEDKVLAVRRGQPLREDRRPRRLLPGLPLQAPVQRAAHQPKGQRASPSTSRCTTSHRRQCSGRVQRRATARRQGAGDRGGAAPLRPQRPLPGARALLHPGHRVGRDPGGHREAAAGRRRDAGRRRGRATALGLRAVHRAAGLRRRQDHLLGQERLLAGVCRRRLGGPAQGQGDRPGAVRLGPRGRRRGRAQIVDAACTAPSWNWASRRARRVGWRW